MDEIYRGYRTAVTSGEGWVAKITHVRGHRVPVGAQATLSEGEDVCVRRAKQELDLYLNFLALKCPDNDVS